ncbi:hypothetical protein [Lentibacillus sediminis]|uniref:hypothetical protein n=1 Tax=Lentibacillus sediminis TaxID=1940529 RepID=UPI000C1C6680|nr:hypothetical protein [Lentibacillus sediminis]
MNTEINLLEKKPKKFLPVLVWGLVFAVLLAAVVILLIMQQNHFEDRLAALGEERAQVEAVLEEQQVQYADARQLERLQQGMAEVQREAVPTIPLYQEILSLFSAQGQLLGYHFTEENSLVINGAFASLQETADYIADLQQYPYAAYVNLDSVSMMENAYQATIHVGIDREILREVLGTNENALD